MKIRIWRQLERRLVGPAGRDHLVKEACDVLFHLWVILATRQITVEQLRAELERREGVSGIVEKQNRQKEQQGQ
jgi:phosphoribosyl-ATP pyrophosphohydrolase